MIKLRMIRLAGRIAGMEEKRDAHRVLMGRPEGKRTLGRFRHRWDDIIIRWILEK
jgi:hypothetical protein